MTRPRRWAWGSAALLVVAASVAVVAPGLPLTGSAGAADDPISVSVSPTDALADGQPITITIKTSGDTPVSRAFAQVCRDGVTYQSVHQAQPSDDFATGGANCPLQPVSTSADQRVEIAGVNGTAPTPAGSVSRYRVGLGQQDWTNPVDGTKHTITCGPDDHCDLVVEVRNGSTGFWNPYVFKLGYQQTDPITGCGGPATGVLTSGGGDRMQDAWIDWTLDHCHEDGQKGGASRGVFTGEGIAVNSFASGKIDFAYTAAGYGNEVGLLSAANKASPRQAIAVPIALNAAVLAVGGGHTVQVSSDHVKVPYDDLRLTQQELAALLSGGSTSFQPSTDLYNRNPQLNQNFFDTGISAGWLVGAPAEAESNSWFLTEQLLKNVPDAWKVPDLSSYGTDAGKTRTADPSFALANPSYALSLQTLSGRPPLANALAKVGNPATQGAIWVVTDLETANALGMTVVKIANQHGDFVPVDQASVTAGVKSMKQTDNGLLLPDPAAVDQVDGVTPYPLSFVEYALVPAEPLVNETKATDGTISCSLRTDSQKLLTGWLDYVTGAGQQKLPAGMFPVTPELGQQAQTAIAQVGQAPVTGDCAGKISAPAPTTTTTVARTTTTTAAPAADDGGSSGATDGTVANGSTGGAALARPASAYRSVSVGTPTVRQPDSTPATTPSDDVKLTSVPAFAGRRSVSWTGALLALIGLTALSGLAALMASGRVPDLDQLRRRKP